MHAIPIALALFQAVFPHVVSEDSAEALRRAARSAEREYEYLLRQLAPIRMGGGGGGECDERVGRFCLTYNSGDPPELDPAPPRVVRARQDVVEALRLAFAALPGDLATAGPLLRYLIEDERADEALSAALTYAWASEDSVWGPLLLGYAFHVAGDDTAAEQRFAEALARMSDEERHRVEGVDVFLSGDERGVYKDLDPDARAAYEERFWRYADPLYLIPGNERRAEHFARHVWSRLLSEAPRVRGMNSWGRDLEELTLRYGVPTARERILKWSALSEDSYVEHYHPDQLAFLPDSLRTVGIPHAPPPGDPWPLDRERSRSGFAPRRVRRLVSLRHQVSRFPDGDSVAIHAYGRLPLDSAVARPAGVDAGFFVLDTRPEPLREQRAAAVVLGDAATAAFELRVAPGVIVYSFEVLDREGGLAGRARYALDVPAYPSSGVALSDPVVAEPFGPGELPRGRSDARLRPLADLVLEPGDTIGLYAEAHGLAPAEDRATQYAVELVLHSRDGAALVTRALRWLGRTLGITGEKRTPRLSWSGRGEGGRAAILAVNIPLVDLDPGLYELELTVTDRVDESSYTSRRVFRIRD